MAALVTLLVGFTLIAAASAYRLKRLTNPQRRRPSCAGQDTHLMIALGSGGHTTEMLTMLMRAVVTEPRIKQRLCWNKDYSHRTWVVSSGDVISVNRARHFESTVAKHLGEQSVDYDIVAVPRAREIHQPLYTTPISCLRCISACCHLLLRHTALNRDAIDFPDVILCNGPATATILIFTSLLLRFFNVRGCSSRRKMRTVYIESWARVKRLSLSGRLLKHVVDRFIVQWPQLQQAAGGRAEYVGVLV
ncbi:glycosyltransferase family 1 protein [Piedraia hortae CBS 480.64]|uniref:UDP-N-acetylglucosamine transferase subunit ALG14 n=1 Tax=Piedraia hortae CBS 480.64 TaxID=1314780 RepID=A0A6A7CAL1_9PEZI|nr:glycosyltransferase family 1 protein [Piedraia hortae CBS 480.64]